MDVVRGVAALLIVVHHAVVLLDDYGGPVPPGWADDASDALAPFRIPTLVLLSGMLLGPSLRKGGRRYAAGKLRNLAWPYLVWTVIFGALSWPVWSVPGFLLGGSYLWFLLFLLVFYAGAWVLRAAPTALVVGAALVAAVLAPDGHGYLERLPYLFALFMTGHLAARRGRAWSWLVRSPWALVAAVAVVAAHVPTTLGSAYGPRSLLLTLAGVVLLAQASRRVAHLRALRPVRFAGRNSLVYYLVHYPAIAAVVTLAGGAAGGPGAPVLVALSTALALALATALALLRQRPAVAWLFQAPALRRASRAAPVTAGAARSA